MNTISDQGGAATEKNLEEGKYPDRAAIDRFWEQVDNAKMLLDYGIAGGRTKKIEDRIIENIERLVLADRRCFPEKTELFEFMKAYRDLGLLLSPVTATTLKMTSKHYGRKRWTSLWISKISDAVHWSRWLALLTMLFISLIVLHSWLLKEKVVCGYESISGLNALLDILAPFFYGGLGACAYLLKSCHSYIRNRSFDVFRKPEYMNRIMLGLLAGGVIVLFVNQQLPSDGKGVSLSAAALGFIAGYSNDVLFQMIERITKTIFPKTEGEKNLHSSS